MTKYYMAKQTDPKPLECSATTLKEAQLEAEAYFAGCPPRVPIYVLELEKPPGWTPGDAPYKMYRCLPWVDITEDIWVIRGGAEKELRLAVRHPGELLQEHFMYPRRMSTRELATHLEKDLRYTVRLLRGARVLTSDDAHDLAELFGTSKEFWLNLQRDYDLRMKNEPTT
ncbi:HigA family addiction module antitoxin [Thiolapillus sp.]|uniref:HigA family addiction module antitoxin n=1 Tax=Thiolapillus sp. TaxID=2017437 RepID=UPI003AF9E151